MNLIDAFFLGGIVLVALIALNFFPRLKGLDVGLMVLVFLALLLQLGFNGFYWNFLPAYFLFLIVAGSAFSPLVSSSYLFRTSFKVLIILLVFGSILPWAILNPVPSLTKSTGEYKIGTQIFRWVDLNREEENTMDPDDHRNVIVQAWYPTDPNAKGLWSIYMDGISTLPEKVGGIPSWILSDYDKIDTGGVLNAPISQSREKWPVLVFLTGNVSSRAFYTSILTGLASEGFVVLAIDHPYEAVISELVDGTVVTTIERRLENDPELLQMMKNRLDLRVEDVLFVLNTLEVIDCSLNPFFGSLDLAELGVFGHSLGGATAGVLLGMDSRIKAAVNVDGTLYGSLPEPTEKKPFLLIESQKDSNNTYQRYEEGNRQFFELFGGGDRLQLTNADHLSFTDVPLFLGLPARLFSGKLLGFGGDTRETHKITVRILSSFFISNFYNKTFEMPEDRYPSVIRKPID